MDFNDSFGDEEPFSQSRAEEHGRKIGATHALICIDIGDEQPSVVYVMPGECAETVRDQCLGGCPSVTIVDLEHKEMTTAIYE